MSNASHSSNLFARIRERIAHRTGDIADGHDCVARRPGGLHVPRRKCAGRPECAEICGRLFGAARGRPSLQRDGRRPRREAFPFRLGRLPSRRSAPPSRFGALPSRLKVAVAASSFFVASAIGAQADAGQAGEGAAPSGALALAFEARGAASKGAAAKAIPGGVARDAASASHEASAARAKPATVPAGKYVALGDSYASGDGVPPYAEGTDEANGNRCRRSSSAYAHRVSGRVGKTLDFGACSGARTGDFYKAKSAWGEPAQLSRLDASTGLVTFAIGGNDAGFSRVLSDCIGGKRLLPFVACSTDRAVTGPVDSAIDALRGKTKKEGVRSYDSIAADIRSRAPSATVVAVGYPRIFPAGGGTGGPIPGRCQGVKKVDQRWMTAKTDELDAALKAAALRHGFLFADTASAFGGHELCGSNGSWIHDILNDGRFHPTQAGHSATAQVVADALGGLGGQSDSSGSAKAGNSKARDGKAGDARAEGAQARDAQARKELQVAADRADNERPAGAIAVERDGDRMSLDASASTDADGKVIHVDWYVQRSDGGETVVSGARTSIRIPSEEKTTVTAVVTDDRGMEDFVTRHVPAAKQAPRAAKGDGLRRGRAAKAEGGYAVKAATECPPSCEPSRSLRRRGSSPSPA